MIFQRCALLDVKGDVVDLNVCAQYVVCVYMHCVCLCSRVRVRVCSSPRVSQFPVRFLHAYATI